MSRQKGFNDRAILHFNASPFGAKTSQAQVGGSDDSKRQLAFYPIHCGTVTLVPFDRQTIPETFQEGFEFSTQHSINSYAKWREVIIIIIIIIILISSYYLMMCLVKILLICSLFLSNLCWLVTHGRGTKNPLAVLSMVYSVLWLCSISTKCFNKPACMHHRKKNCLQNQHTTHLFYAQLVVEAYNMYFSTLCAIFSTLILQGTCTQHIVAAHCCVLFQHTKINVLNAWFVCMC